MFLQGTLKTKFIWYSWMYSTFFTVNPAFTVFNRYVFVTCEVPQHFLTLLQGSERGALTWIYQISCFFNYLPHRKDIFQIILLVLGIILLACVVKRLLYLRGATAQLCVRSRDTDLYDAPKSHSPTYSAGLPVTSHTHLQHTAFVQTHTHTL